MNMILVGIGLFGVIGLEMACGILPKEFGTRAIGAGISERSNGFVVRLEPIGADIDVSAMVSPNSWVLVTIVDPTADVSRFGVPDPSIVDSVFTTVFPSAVQISLRFRARIRSVEVTRTPGGNDALISVFRE